ncbi:putative START-like domain-containing protein [Rosa chinensis]|uniref:Putative START-like domain-containing protein n=1 Tax=Rosa chinensis TaxID=74649 RepID=A0A2P6R3G5_ROSCH|nr:putative START-like domain-containing protein [Rosa chinensis]
MSSDYGKVEADVELKASAAKFHEFFTRRPHHLSNISSDKIKECNLHEGEWGTVGSIIHWNYVHDGKTKVAKEVFEAIDDENNSITLKVVEGDLLEHYKSFKVTIEASPKGEGCTVHWTFEYEKVHGDVEDPHTLLQLVVDITKDICSHLST